MPEKDKKSTVKAAKQEQAVKSAPPWPLITVGVLASVVTLAVVAMGCFAFSTLRHSDNPMLTMSRIDRDGSSHISIYHDGAFDTPRKASPVTSGVVTSVEGETLTVSGHGKQVTVKRTSDTTVTGDKSDVSVNDTVVVIGSKADDGTLTARHIIVRNDDEPPFRFMMEENVSRM